MRTRTSEIDSKIIELYQIRGQRLATVAEAIGWPQVTTYGRIRELGIRRDRAIINKMRSDSLKGHPVSKEVSERLSEKLKGKHTSPQTEFKKGQVPWNKDKKMPPETGQKVAAKLRGKPTWNKGIPMHEWMTEESNEIRKEKITENNPRYWLGKKRPELYADPTAREKQAELTALSWQNPAIREKRIKNMLKALNRRPTKPEQRILNICQSYRLFYRYTGDGSIIIAGLNPDFINCNGKKKLIEVFGRVYHDPNKCFSRALSLTDLDQYRKAHYASFGFDCLILWDDEMAKLSDEEIANLIKKFTKSRKRVTPQLKMEVI